MGTSWTKSGFQFKSPLRSIVRFLLRSRESKANKCRELKAKLDETVRQLERCQKDVERLQQENRELQQKIRRRETEQQTSRMAAIQLPSDPPIGGHGYGARMISLAVNLAQVVGFRATPRGLRIVFEWLGVETRIPHWTAVRSWMQRAGLAALEESVEPADDWIWIADHSNQIGPEKALVVLGIRACQMPPPGTALRHEDLRVLLVQPGTQWKKDDVAAAYAKLATRCGIPRALLSDGAVELRDGAVGLKNQRADLITLQDFKHKAANLLEGLIGRGLRFAEFNVLLGRTRSAIQQTELAHLTPPSHKQKARFMNLGPILRWAESVGWLLEHPQAQARHGITTQRLEEKLGWLRSFADDVATWRECQKVVERGVEFINQQGLFRGSAEQLRAAVGNDLKYEASLQLTQKLVDFVAQAERQISPGERLPMSTEILESSFALYKQLERQHSKGGFTSLLVAFGALLRKSTPDTIKKALSLVSVRDVKAWVQEHLGDTLTSKRVATYNESRLDTLRATKYQATT